MIIAILTQGANSTEWLWEYAISHSLDGFTWVELANSFYGNNDATNLQRNVLVEPLMTRYVRLSVVAFNVWPSLRWGLEGYPL